jgi:hypothetical protein
MTNRSILIDLQTWIRRGQVPGMPWYFNAYSVCRRLVSIRYESDCPVLDLLRVEYA